MLDQSEVSSQVLPRPQLHKQTKYIPALPFPTGARALRDLLKHNT